MKPKMNRPSINLGPRQPRSADIPVCCITAESLCEPCAQPKRCRVSALQKLFLAIGVWLAGSASGLGQPVITNQPQNQTNVVGSTATFSVGAMGTPPLSYQWRGYTGLTVFTNLVGETNTTLSLTNVQPSAANFRYGVVVSDTIGSATSVLARLTVLVPPSISVQPTNQVAEVGSTANFSVTATGSLPLRYQWRSNDADLANRTNSTLLLASVQFTNAGIYRVIVANAAGAVTSQVATLKLLSVGATFTKITSGSIVTDGGFSGGCAWGDYDGDGFIDLFVANALVHTNFLYRNNRDGTFTRMTNASLGSMVSDVGDSSGGAWADYDNDGYLDLFVVNYRKKSFLYHNNGDGSFTKIMQGPVVNDVGDGVAAAWADYDNDGAVDLFVSVTASLTNFLYHGNGDGTFTRIVSGDLATDWGGGQVPAWGDYDNDGDLDLFLPNNAAEFFPAPYSNNLFYVNTGGGSFTRIASGNIAADPGFAHACAWGDYDNDGYLDLFVTQNSNAGRPKSLLYHNDRNGNFTRITQGDIVNDLGDSTGCAWGDYDNDGFLDLFVANRDRSNFLYRNNGDGTFAKITSGAIVNDGGISVGCAWGDYDNDGFLDLFVANGEVTQSQNNFLYHNNGNSNQWIKVQCVGTASNRSAIGAKVRVAASIGGVMRWQLREISGGSGLGQNDLRANIGLGDATNVHTVRIEWPSGTVQEFHNLAVKQILTVTEPPRLQTVGMAPGGSFQLLLTGGVGLRYDIETSADLAAWTLLTSVTNVSRTMTISDVGSTHFNQRFYRALSR